LHGRALNPGIPASLPMGDESTTVLLYDVPVELRFFSAA
jgi:hypothetical protein